MAQSSLRNNKRLFSVSGGDPSLPDRVTYLENNEYKILYFQSISAATGTITKPTNSTILLDQFYEGGDAIVETLINGQPSEQSPVTAGGAVVSVSSFDTSGNYTLSGTPSSYPVALVYILKIKAEDYQNLVTANIMAMDEVSPISQTITDGVTDKAPSEDAVYDALALKLDANNAAVTNARNRKYFAYDNTTYTYTGATGDTILKTILIPGGTMGINSTLELFANFMKSGTAGNPAYLVYIGTSASALSGGNSVQYIQPGATSLQSGIWVRLSTKNSQTSINTKGLSQVALIPQTSQTIPINNRAFDWASDLYVHIYATGANAADTQGIQDYQMYIDNP